MSSLPFSMFLSRYDVTAFRGRASGYDARIVMYYCNHCLLQTSSVYVFENYSTCLCTTHVSVS